MNSGDVNQCGELKRWSRSGGEEITMSPGLLVLALVSTLSIQELWVWSSESMSGLKLQVWEPAQKSGSEMKSCAE